METPNLLDLPFEVLDLIFKHLYEHEKWQLAIVNKNLGRAFASHIRDEYERVSIHYNSSWFLETILPLCGSTVRHIETTHCFDSYESLAWLIENDFENLQSLTIDIDFKKVSYMNRFLRSGVKLQSVEIHICIDFKLFSRMIGALMGHPRFKGLDLYNISKGLGRLVKQFTDLEVLKLEFSPIQEKINIFEVCVLLNRLRNLKISLTQIQFLIDDQEFEALETIEIKCCIITTETLPFFKSLKTICLEHNFTSEGMALTWILKHSNTLENLTTDIRDIQTDDFFKLIKSCRKLRYLYLKVDIDELLSKGFITTFLNILQENGIDSNNPFQLVTKKITFGAIKSFMPNTPTSKLLDFYTYEH